MKMNSQQFALFQKQLANVIKNSAFYQKKFAGLDPASIRTQEDFETLPFTSKGDLREAYPLGLQGVPDKDIVRIHSSSGTTGTPVVIPYTAKDVDDWGEMFKRHCKCFFATFL